MTTDLLFSILPRLGKVAIDHDSQKVVRIDKQEELRALSDEEKELKNEEKEAREKQQKQNRNKQSQALATPPEKVDQDIADPEDKKPKGPKHLDIYV